MITRGLVDSENQNITDFPARFTLSAQLQQETADNVRTLQEILCGEVYHGPEVL